jgi:hypothetical protein
LCGLLRFLWPNWPLGSRPSPNGPFKRVSERVLFRTRQRQRSSLICWRKSGQSCSGESETAAPISDVTKCETCDAEAESPPEALKAGWESTSGGFRGTQCACLSGRQDNPHRGPAQQGILHLCPCCDRVGRAGHQHTISFDSGPRQDDCRSWSVSNVVDDCPSAYVDEPSTTINKSFVSLKRTTRQRPCWPISISSDRPTENAYRPASREDSGGLRKEVSMTQLAWW